MRKRTVRILTGIGILIVALAALYAIAVSVSAIKLRRAYAALEKDGRPMRASGIIPAKVPDNENAALLYESAALLLKAQPAGEKGLLEHLGLLAIDYANGSADPNQREELRQLMQQEDVASAIWIVQTGATRPACRFERQYNGEWDMPYLRDLRFLTAVLGAKTILEGEAGRTEQAWDMALIQLKLANALRTDPGFIVCQLVRLAQINMACKTIQRLCATSMPDDECYRHLQDRLAGFDDVSPLVLAIDGERLLFGEWAFALERDDLQEFLAKVEGDRYTPGFVQRLKTQYISFKPLWLADHAAYLHLMRHCTAQLQAPSYDRNEVEILETKVAEAARRHVLTGLLAPAMGRIKEIYLRMIGELRVTRAGLALLRYREAHGAFPETLDVLGLDYVQDPFSKKPLVYRPEREGFVLYSIAQDQQDNGGRPRQPKEYTDYDLVWHFRSHAD